MSVIKNQYEQLRMHLDRLSDKQKIVFATVSVVAVLGVIGIGWWSSRPHYVPLAEGLSFTVAGEVKTKLDSVGIPNQLSFSGTGVMVPTNKVSEARVHVGDLLGGNESTSFDGGMFPTPGDDENKRLRQLETAIANSLLKMKHIDLAEVHIAKPDPTPFLTERSDTTASVILGIRRGSQFGPQQAMTVVQLVSGSVDGLMPENVNVSDLHGTRWTGEAVGDATLSSSDAFRQKLQAEKAMAAQDILSKFTGIGKAVVRVSADIDFTNTTSTHETFDVDSKFAASETINNSTIPSAAASGAAGAASNLTPGANAGSANATGTTESIESKFEVPKKTDVIVDPGGKLLRLTVSAIVDVPAADPNNPNAPQPPTKQEIEEAIKTAVGFNDTRDDKISVLLQPLVDGPLIDVATPPTAIWDALALIAKNASLGIAAIVALVLGFLFLKKIQPVLEAPAPAAQASAQERSRVLAELSEQAKQNPEVISKILSAWLESSRANSVQPDLKVYDEKRAA